MRSARTLLAVLVAALLGAAVFAAPALAAPRPAAPATSDMLSSVSCSRVSACVTVGGRVHTGFENESISYVWNGTAWRFHPMVDLARARYQSSQGVDCLTPANCIAVGDATRVSGSTFTQYPVVEHWNGTKWRLRNLRLPKGSQLRGVSCARRLCMIVGSVPTRSGSERPLVVRVNGTRRVVTSLPVPAGRTAAAFSGVSCTSASACTAVGAASPGPPGNSGTDFAERWEGGHWRSLRVPRPDGLAALLSVSCTAATRCMAAGWPVAGIATAVFPLTLRENAGHWSTVAVAGSRLPNYEPQAVSCASTKQCLTAGFSNTSAASRPGAAIWDGHTMTFELVPGVSSGEFFSISCRAVNRCMAVGFTQVGTANPTGGLAESWNGSRWKLLPLAGK